MPENFTFNRPQPDGTTVPERVTLERWRWRATYDDGTVLDQFDFSTGVFHQFKEIEQEKVAFWELINSDRPSLTILTRPGDQLIHGYRVIGLDYMSGPDHTRIKLYKFGYIRGGVTFLMVLGPDDRVIVTDDPNNITIGEK